MLTTARNRVLGEEMEKKEGTREGIQDLSLYRLLLFALSPLDESTSI